MYYVYALRSLAQNYIYIGLTNNLERRVEEHNKGWEKTTRVYRPFKLIKSYKFNTRQEAREFEKYLKSSGIRKLKIVTENDSSGRVAEWQTLGT